MQREKGLEKGKKKEEKEKKKKRKYMKKRGQPGLCVWVG